MNPVTAYTYTGLIRTHTLVPDHPDPNFTFVSNEAIDDMGLSFDAKGLLFSICTYRGEPITIAMLVDGGPEPEEVVRSYLAELHEAGYLSNYRLIGGDL